MSARPPLPVTRAILIADGIITEAGTQKKSLIGIYSNVVAPRLPFMRTLNVFIQLADALGEYTFRIELVHMESEAILHQGEVGPIKSENPLKPIEIVMHLPSRFEQPGQYEIRVSHEGHVFAARSFGVEVAPDTPPATSNGKQ